MGSELLLLSQICEESINTAGPSLTAGFTILALYYKDI